MYACVLFLVCTYVDFWHVFVYVRMYVKACVLWLLLRCVLRAASRTPQPTRSVTAKAAAGKVSVTVDIECVCKHDLHIWKK